MIKPLKVRHTDDNKIVIDISGGELDEDGRTITFDNKEASQIGLELTDSSNDAIIKALLVGVTLYRAKDKNKAMRFALEQFLEEDEIKHYLSELVSKQWRRNIERLNKYTEEVFKSN